MTESTEQFDLREVQEIVEKLLEVVREESLVIVLFSLVVLASRLARTIAGEEDPCLTVEDVQAAISFLQQGGSYGR